ncbi:MAG: AtpZ/AtpI family protein [Clostridiales bacterium]
MGKKVSPGVYTYIRIASTFGLTMGMNIYLFSVLLGGWLDERYGTDPLFRLILMFVALGMSFAYLFKQASVAQSVEEENIRAEEERKKNE